MGSFWFGFGFFFFSFLRELEGNRATDYPVVEVGGFAAFRPGVKNRAQKQTVMRACPFRAKHQGERINHGLPSAGTGDD